MTPDTVVDLFREAMLLVILIVCLMVVPSLLVGLVISIFQAATQINEQTLSFLPRLLTTIFMLIIFGPFILNEMMEFTNRLVTSLPLLIG
ncbi:MAG: flagellar biosynthesis protein FliQ [Oceanicoccus sp.]|uniref:flagellar biosynthesis protein FliQ n=1 Tax=Oceanicoccus sp. TaxID=2691044 RepID=UPI00262F15AF|nr:flagellar biosynthesis protein FliQ [Oceanicoccus sp.]MCP3908124.1 flagellar biosynthesis protein FliQ [Oceanicoccus sp.]MDG1771940.1 flagellar biosynthesis protein FliQ [Oceanicoccus sp.]